MHNKDYYWQYKKYISGYMESGHAHDLDPGLIIEFLYNRKRVLAFILNPDWEMKVHVLKMNSIPIVYFDQIFNRIKIDDEKLIKEALSEMKFPVDPLIERPKLFYHTVIKTNHAFHLYKPYRTYNMHHMKDVKVVHYDFSRYIDNKKV